MWGLIGSIVFVVALFAGFLYYPPELLFPEAASANSNTSVSYFSLSAIRAFLILATVISLAVYLVRVAAKMTFSSFHLQRDAEERRQLTLVYLALIREDAASQEDRDIILNSLFSRADIGILGGDSAPTMPTSFVDRIIGGGSK